jgi:hypothetical protein
MYRTIQVLAGAFLLTLGGLFYLAPDLSAYTWLGQKCGSIEISFLNLPQLLGPLRGPFPEFIHPLAFSLIGMGLFSRTRRSRVWICLTFASMNVLFELGQLFDGPALNFIPTWFDNIPVIENTKNFVLNGTFSIIDLLAVLIGTAFAFLFADVLLTARRKNEGRKNEVSSVVV